MSITFSHFRCAALTALLGTLVIASGCGRSIKSVPVSGRVTLGGQPLVDVALNFSPSTGGENAYAAYGKTDQDGRYTLRLVENGQPGATAGVTTQTMQFHGAADRYTLAGATSWATLFSTATQSTNNPAVTVPSPAPNHIMMAVSKDFGQTWSAPVPIASPPNARVLWPWAVAGDAGRLSIVWYQTSKVVDPDCQASDVRIYEARVDNATDPATRSVAIVNA